jgi:DNA-binding LacI/PurR family transcriptional regulator
MIPAATRRRVACPRYAAAARAEAGAAILAGPDRPTAILAVADGLALDLMAAAQARGIEVPWALSVVGFDDIPAAGQVTPALTTFDASIPEAAAQLAEMLLARIRAPHAPHETRLLRPRLVLRGSHGPGPGARGADPAAPDYERDQGRKTG